jgi:hypothetical protein
MSKSARLEWHDQLTILNRNLKTFMQQPGDAEVAAMLAAMREYAQASRQGQIEIPVTWNSYD